MSRKAIAPEQNILWLAWYLTFNVGALLLVSALGVWLFYHCFILDVLRCFNS